MFSVGRLNVTLHKIRKRGCRHVGVPFSDNMARKSKKAMRVRRKAMRNLSKGRLKTAIYCQNMPSN